MNIPVSIRDLHQKKKLVLVLVLSVLDTTRTRRAKKAVVWLTELIAAFITIHGLWTFLADVYGLLDQPGKTIWLSVNHCRLGPVDRVILLLRVVS